MEPKYPVNFSLTEEQKNLSEKLKTEHGLSHHDIYLIGLKSLEKNVKKPEAKKA